jgi:diguanylate cyclase
MYAVLFLLFIESQIVGRRYAMAQRLAERLSNNLRDEVALQTAELNEQNKMLASAHQALRTANKALREISNTDGLTQLYNRMYFENELHKEWRRSSRSQSPLSVLMLDADHFKQINDSAGHKVGDLCLQAIAKTMNSHFKRAGEIVARYGGEEFIVMLPQTDQRKALAIAEGLRCAIANTVIQHQQQQFRITVSIGISTSVPSHKHSPDMMLEAADSALYDAKAGGRNRVSIVPLLNHKPASKAQQKLL